MRHVGEVVGRLDLLEHVWESYGATEANVVEVYIGYLRRKIDTPFDRQGHHHGARRRLPVGTRWRLIRSLRRCRCPAKPANGRVRRGRSLRARLVLLATVGLAIGLAIGGVALTVLLRSALERASDEAARQTAQDVVVLVDAGRLPDPLPAGGTTLVQVVDQQGRVLAASAGADRLVPAVSADQLSAARVGPVTVPGAQFGVLGPVRVTALPAGTPSDPSTVVVGSPSGDIDDAVRVVRTVLIVGFVLLLAVLAVVLLAVCRCHPPAGRDAPGGRREDHRGELERHPAVAGLGRRDPPTGRDAERHARPAGGVPGRQRAFVADAAHELRSPLTSLRTQLEVAAATGDDPDPADLVAEVDRLTGLVEDLLLLARVDDGKPPPRQRLDIADMATSIARRYASSRIPVTVRVADEPAVTCQPRSGEPGAGQSAGQRGPLCRNRSDRHRCARPPRAARRW